MIFYTQRARNSAREQIAELHIKLASVPLNQGLTLDDVRALHMYLDTLDKELIKEIKQSAE